MKRHFLPGRSGLWPLLTAGLLFSSFARGADNDTFRISTVRAVMDRITDGHHQVPAIDDQFSAFIWKRFLENQDPRKIILLQSDIERLRSWEKRVDDELKTPSIGFYNEASAILTQRTAEILPVFRTLLAQPLAYTSKEVWDDQKLSYPVSVQERKRHWERYVKLCVLQKVMDLQAATPSLSFAAAEKDARAKVLAWLNSIYIHQSEEQRFSVFMNTVAMETDPHTMFYAPLDNLERQGMLNHRYFGLGMELSAGDGEVRIARILPGGPADRSGLLQANDLIKAISDEKGVMVGTEGRSAPDVSRLVRGDSGTVVHLLVARDGREQKVALTRGEIRDNTNAVKTALFTKEGTTYGYIHLPQFYMDLSRADGAQCAVDMAKAVMQLKEKQVAGIVIDLRGNGGGALDQVQRIAALFVENGPVTLAKRRDAFIRYDIYSLPEVVWQGPLTILIDEGSASASEMFSGAMQDYGRAVIIGSPSSYGKGTMQETLPMGKMGSKTKGIAPISYGSLALTVGRFYRITGASNQLAGIRSDVVLPSKAGWNIFRERNFPTAFMPDSVDGAFFRKSKYADALPAIIAAAQSRVMQDTAFVSMWEATGWLAAHAKDARSLTYKTFRDEAVLKAGYEQRAAAAARLPKESLLNVSAAGEAAASAAEQKRYQQWLQDLSADRALWHTADVLRDLGR